MCERERERKAKGIKKKGNFLQRRKLKEKNKERDALIEGIKESDI